MSKLTKLATKPNLFFRDYFLKKAPLSQKEKQQLAPKLKPEVQAVAKKAPTPAPAPAPAKKAAVSPTPAPVAKAVDDLSQMVEDIYPITFPVDIVYTWVNSDDEEFNKSRLAHQKQFDASVSESKSESTDIARFESRDELKYSIRSVLTYAPWVNHIYIVTNGQVPKWLDESYDKVTVITHSQIIEPEFLPTFNSHAIESALHKIPNLSEHFIYFNDDVMLTRPLPASYFFTSSGTAKLFITNSKLPNGDKNVNDSPTQWAAKNSRQLLLAETGFWVDVMFAHTFHPQVKSVHQEIERLWPNEVATCRKNKFRDGSDLNVATFLHHHLALIRGQAIATRTRCMYFNIREKQASNLYKSLLTNKGKANATHSICLNDRVSSVSNELEDFDIKLRNFLEAYYPDPSDAEIFVPSKRQLAKMVSDRRFAKIYDVVEKLHPSVFSGDDEVMHLHYYYGMACWMLYQENEQKELLDKAYQNLQLFCDKNPEHSLANDYLEMVLVALFGKLQQDAELSEITDPNDTDSDLLQKVSNQRLQNADEVNQQNNAENKNGSDDQSATQADDESKSAEK